MKRKKDEQTVATIEQTADQANAPTAAVVREPGDEPIYPPAPNPFGVHHDNRAGVELSNYSNRENGIYESWIKFREGKPSDQVRQHMKDNGFIWRGDVPKGGHFDVAGAWTLKIPYPTRNATRLKGERVFAKVVDMILEEKGLVPEPELERF